MSVRAFDVILLPTLRCDAACEYCFESKSRGYMSLGRLAAVMGKVMDFMEEDDLDLLTVNWQGGEVMTLPVSWFEDAHAMIQEAGTARSLRIEHGIQTNLIGYSDKWVPILYDMFGGRVSTSFDYPNLHRRFAKGGPEEYDRVWMRNFQAAREAGLDIGVIVVPNEKTLEIGAASFYHHLVEVLQITNFQINTPFAGGPPSPVKSTYPLDPDRLGLFMADLADLWWEEGIGKGVRIGPLDELLRLFQDRPAALPCIWQDNCARGFICIDPEGYVSQCDCWAASHPGYRFGNILKEPSLGELLRKSPVRRKFIDRPAQLVTQEECISCEYLAFCHGGCPARVYGTTGRISSRDPYCSTYKKIFGHTRGLAGRCGSPTRDRSGTVKGWA